MGVARIGLFREALYACPLVCDGKIIVAALYSQSLGTWCY